MEENIKLTDFIDFRETTFKKITDSLARMDSISKRYIKTDDIHELEKVKKELNAELQYLATLYSQTKVYKSSNHTYLEDAIRTLKSKTISKVMDEAGLKITAAENLYAAQPYYTERLAVLLKAKQFFIKVEELYDRYNFTLQCVIQSISIASKEMQNSKMS